MLKNLLIAAAGVTIATLTAPVQAATIFWSDWTSGNVIDGGFQAEGTITTNSSTVDVTYTNPQGIAFFQDGVGPEINYWQQMGGGLDPATSAYTSDLVDNIPTGTDMIALFRAGNQTLTFSETIANPVFSYVSLNGNGYAFDQDFEILSVGGAYGNACGYWGT
ncbi:MAG: hypothetical protein F6K23_37375 [Okeania sp. SIO2C9]|uniref:hypothetical protein n=1 Tax=Okeania sp. SIO2C9 TaxID=2607791 RepID=UPI0013C02F4C|nr:hypothetical protein [Okeania sp. SIO2C9]NEQ78169.1 hypothetical protein [Okeania sp. SIO2C9]